MRGIGNGNTGFCTERTRAELPTLGIGSGLGVGIGLYIGQVLFCAVRMNELVLDRKSVV